MSYKVKVNLEINVLWYNRENNIILYKFTHIYIYVKISYKKCTNNERNNSWNQMYFIIIKELLRYLKLMMSHKFRIIKDIIKTSSNNAQLMYKLKKAIVLHQINLWFEEFLTVFLIYPEKKLIIRINRHSIPSAESKKKKSLFIRRKIIPAAKKENEVERGGVSLKCDLSAQFLRL